MRDFALGDHLLLDVYDGTFSDLNSPNFLRKVFTRAILRSNMNILNEYTHKFSPCGVTLLFALSESHVSCHTWPEIGCLTADFFTCGENNPKIGAEYVIECLKSEKYKLRLVQR